MGLPLYNKNKINNKIWDEFLTVRDTVKIEQSRRQENGGH